MDIIMPLIQLADTISALPAVQANDKTLSARLLSNCNWCTPSVAHVASGSPFSQTTSVEPTATRTDTS